MESRKNIAEECVVSILLNYPDKILTEHLEARWFGKHRRIIEVMLKLAADGKEVDAIYVAEALGDKDGVLKKLVEIQTQVFAGASNYPFRVDSVRKLFEAQAIHAAVKKAGNELETGNEPGAVLSGLIADSMKLTSIGGQKFNYTAKESLKVFIEKLEETFDARDTGGIGLKTGIKALDSSMGGLHPSDMAIVGARPGVGKTAFAVSVLRNIAKTGKKVGFFSTEMSVFQVMGRFASMEGNINAHKLREADLDDADFARISAAAHSIQSWDIRICDKPAITIGELAMQARVWAADGGIDFIAVDYLTRLHPDKAGSNQNLDVGTIVTGLKNIARTLNIPIMVLAQLNRQSTTRKDKRPVMSDLRDSGIIEQEADQILMLYRPDGDSEGFGGPEIIIEKNRHGESGIVRCEFEPSTMCWRDKEFDYAEQQASF